MYKQYALETSVSETLKETVFRSPPFRTDQEDREPFCVMIIQQSYKLPRRRVSDKEGRRCDAQPAITGLNAASLYSLEKDASGVLANAGPGVFDCKARTQGVEAKSVQLRTQAAGTCGDGDEIGRSGIAVIWTVLSSILSDEVEEVDIGEKERGGVEIDADGDVTDSAALSSEGSV